MYAHIKSISSELISNVQIHLFCFNIPGFPVSYYDPNNGFFSTENAPEDWLNRPKRPNVIKKSTVFSYYQR